MTLPRPVWLAEEAQISALLNAALDYFDRQPGEARRQRIFLRAETWLTSLARSDDSADQLWALVQELETAGVLEVRKARRNPYDPDWKDAKLAFAATSESCLREWLARERIEPAMQAWRRAVEARAADFPGGCEALMSRRIVVPGRRAEEVVAALARLATIRAPATLRQLSALVFWGHSKILDSRGELVAALFPQLSLRERPIVVAVHLPASFDGVLFIENQDSYSAAVAGFPTQARSLALVYAAGFRGAADRIRTRGGAMLHYAGLHSREAQTQFETWWFDGGPSLGALGFWGDLDFAGMQILKALRGRFADLSSWKPGYDPMVAALRGGGGHKPAVPDTLGQVDPGETGCIYADAVLLPAIRELGQFDQEGVWAEET
jgi:hypothetical protein